MKQDLKVSRFVAVAAGKAAQLRGDSAALKALLEGKREETSLGYYCHGIQYLLAGRTKNVREPLKFLTGGGETVGDSPGGPVRLLSPEQVAQLAAALDEEEADDLGDDHYHAAAMDAAGVYPGIWRRLERDGDPLSQMREVYSYLRSFISRQAKSGNGVLIAMGLEPGLGYETDDGGEDEEESEGESEDRPMSEATADVLLQGAAGRRYDRTQGKPQKELDATFAGMGYRPLGDMIVQPVLKDAVVRAYLAEDATSIAVVVLNQRGAASTTFLASLAQDAIVVVSSALVLEKKKKKLFATMMSKATPAELSAALRKRCAELAPKFGSPVTLPAELASAARAWEQWWSKAG